MQVFCVLLWCMDSYWYYPLFTLFMLIVFECTVVGQRQRTLTDLRAISVPKQQVEVRAPALTCHECVSAASSSIVPG